MLTVFCLQEHGKEWSLLCQMVIMEYRQTKRESLNGMMAFITISKKLA